MYSYLYTLDDDELTCIHWMMMTYLYTLDDDELTCRHGIMVNLLVYIRRWLLVYIVWWWTYL